MRSPAHVALRPFRPADLDALVTFWNQAFCGRRNFAPLTAADFARRVLESPAFDPPGLILAWQIEPDGSEAVVGLVHALRPPPQAGLYSKWGPHHYLALLYVAPTHRRQGIGGRLLAAAENWLYYCPVYAASHAQPCYGTVEGPRPPFFGSSERMGIGARDSELLGFLARRGYAVVDPGDVSLRLALAPRPAPTAPDLAGLQLQQVDHRHPFTGQEPDGRAEMSLWGYNHGYPYTGLVLADGDGVAHGEIAWYPLRQPGAAGLVSFWIAPDLRGRGLGRYLFDLSLSKMSSLNAPHMVYDSVDVHTHLVHHSRASELYRRRGFVVDTIWVNLVKT
jgi:GNAT superfamily N-acetyltransferase